MTAIVFSVPAYGANWKLYFENRLGNKFYIDTESVHRTPESTILVWRKITPSDDAEKKITVESLYDIDCSRRRFRVMQGTIYGDGIRFQEKSDWEYFTPDDLSDALYKTICTKRNFK
jgi:hypothetical protein